MAESLGKAPGVLKRRPETAGELREIPDEALMNAVAAFAESRDVLVNLPVEEFQDVRHTSLLLRCLVEALEARTLRRL